MEKIGKIVAITGSVVDVSFDRADIPSLQTALSITRPDGQKLTLETVPHGGREQREAA